MFKTVKRGGSPMVSRLCLASPVAHVGNCLVMHRSLAASLPCSPFPFPDPCPWPRLKAICSQILVSEFASNGTQTKTHHTNLRMTPTTATLFVAGKWAYRDPLSFISPSLGFPHMGSEGKDAGTRARGAVVWLWKWLYSPSTGRGRPGHNWAALRFFSYKRELICRSKMVHRRD